VGSTISGAAIALKRQGLIDYQSALDSQRRIHQEVVEQTRPNTLILLEHPSVYTAGRRTEAHERPTDGTPVIDVDRGGKITWHGEGQLVGYPIIRLKNRNEVVGFVREIEAALIKVCADFGIQGEQYCDRSGVWVRDGGGDRKIAAIGIRVAKGVTMHGFALNVNPDMMGFNQIIPCGIADAGVTSMQLELGRSISIDEVVPSVEKHMFESISRVAEFITL
jgi:lipoyl(octanoyl) transferase